MSCHSFNIRKRLFFKSPILLAGITLVCTGIALVLFHETLMRQHKNYLVNEVAEQLNWLEMIAREKNWDSEKILNEYVRLGVKHELLGATGEFQIAVQEGDKVRFLLEKNIDPNKQLASKTPLQDSPMQQSLEGKKGTMIGMDEHGHRVLAAFAPVPHLNWGLVAKTDLREVLIPFMQSAAVLVLTVLVVILAGIPLLVQLGKPLIRDLEQSQECVSKAIQGSLHTISHSVSKTF